VKFGFYFILFYLFLHSAVHSREKPVPLSKWLLAENMHRVEIA
jgi:hypothetical protein